MEIIVLNRRRFDALEERKIIASASDKLAITNLKLMDQLYFEAWNKKDWEMFRRLHTKNVVVINIDGTKTIGIDEYLKNIKQGLDTFKSLIVKAHPIRIGSDNWTSAVGEIELTTQDNKKITSLMCTAARWENNQIAEEHLSQNGNALIEYITNSYT